MRILYHFLIIVFVVSSLFVIKDDVISIYYKGESYVKNNISTIRKIPESIKGLFFKKVYKEDTSVINYAVKKDSSAEDSTKTTSPGPLRVLNKFVATNNTVNLLQVKVIEMTNNDRRINGNLPPLSMNSKLNLSAQKKLEDMFKNQYFEHVSPSGVGVSELGKEVSYEYILIGENLALGNFRDEKSLLDAWMASPGHRANVLNTHYTEIGVAVGKGSFEGNDVWIAVQHFGLPKSTCPYVDELLHGLIVIEQEEIQNIENNLLLRKANIDSGAIYDGKTKNEQVTEYNEIVIKYNEMIPDIKDKVNKYNEQVATFNLCVENAVK